MLNEYTDNGPMLNAYPDSMGGTLQAITEILEKPIFKNVFQSFYILPSLFHTDLDRGFSVIDYGLETSLAKKEDLEKLQALRLDLKLDFILNHLSVQSPQFQDLLQNGDVSEYKEFFINWNQFWEGHGSMTEEGYIEPDPELIKDMFFRKPGFPILMVDFPDGRKVPYWNTFYQEVKETELGKSYLGQMDLNIKSPIVWEFYEKTLQQLAEYGAKIVRLDAFAYAPKEVGEKNFLNDPGTWQLLEQVRQIADQYQLELLPEIHASYKEGIYETLAAKGYMCYDFFLPGLIIDAMEQESGRMLAQWAQELTEKGIRTVNMLGCHDGIPVLDLKGMIPDERIEHLIDVIVSRGGFIKNLHGQKNMYYQVNATYFSALGNDEKRLLLARAIQMFMPGKPQVWYLDLLAGKNNYQAMEAAGAGGHKEINRTNYTMDQVQEELEKPVVQAQLSMLRMRNTFPAFGFDAELTTKVEGQNLEMVWRKDDLQAKLSVNFHTCAFWITGLDENEIVVWDIKQLS